MEVSPSDTGRLCSSCGGGRCLDCVHQSTLAASLAIWEPELTLPCTALPCWLQLGLRKILKKHDKVCGGQRGRHYLQQCWRQPTGGAFLHSPLLDELKAIQVRVGRPQAGLAGWSDWADCSSVKA